MQQIFTTSHSVSCCPTT